MSDTCPGCGSKLRVSMWDGDEPLHVYECDSTSKGWQGRACLTSQLAAKTAECERMREALERINLRAKSQPSHICRAADFDLRTIADESRAALSPPESEAPDA